MLQKKANKISKLSPPLLKKKWYAWKLLLKVEFMSKLFLMKKLKMIKKTSHFKMKMAR